MLVTIEFGGGVEALFNDQKTIDFEFESCLLADLILQLSSQCSKKELFIKNDTIRPGILVLVNDADWEILGMGDYKVLEKDKITFISTLHGG